MPKSGGGIDDRQSKNLRDYTGLIIIREGISHK
jgi:hypothetical protein